MRLKYFFDTEFIEDGKTIDLVSIGVVCEDGREFYAEVNDVDWSKANPWVLGNVKPHLENRSWETQTPNDRGYSELKWVSDPLPKQEIGKRLRDFTLGFGHKPEFWAYYASYDWVALCQLYGTMMDLPREFPMFVMDIKQYAMDLGNPKLPEQTDTEHNAINDANWNKSTYSWLQKYHLSKLSSEKTIV